MVGWVGGEVMAVVVWGGGVRWGWVGGSKFGEGGRWGGSMWERGVASGTCGKWEGSVGWAWRWGGKEVVA